MPKTPLEAALNIRAQVVPAVLAADRTALYSARCFSALLEQRAAAKLPLDTGLQEIDLAIHALNDAVKARRSAIETHHRLTDLSIKLDSSVCFGPECPAASGATEVVDLAVIRAA